MKVSGAELPKRFCDWSETSQKYPRRRAYLNFAVLHCHATHFLRCVRTLAISHA